MKKKITIQFSIGILAILIFTDTSVRAELREIEENQLSDISAQAFYAVDQYAHGGKDFTRVSVGATIETQFNTDELKLGEYHRWENGAPCHSCTGSEAGLEAQSSDIWIENFSLGTIAERNGRAMDGKTYDKGDIIPFYLKDPYFELAKENNELVGFRMGFGEARGTLSGDIRSLTGNINVAIRDNAWALNDAPNRPWWVPILGVFLLGAPVEGDAQLVSAPNTGSSGVNYDTGGQIDPIRASWIGMPDNSEFRVRSWLGTFRFNTDHCNLFGIPVCFPLSAYQSIDVGERQSNDTYLPTTGLFTSFQTQALQWKDLKSNELTNTPVGAFLNIPSGGIELKLSEAFDGLPRQRVEFIDRGNGLF